MGGKPYKGAVGRDYRIVAFRSAKVALIDRYFRGAKGDKFTIINR
jgi:hypothetical protein